MALQQTWDFTQQEKKKLKKNKWLEWNNYVVTTKNWHIAQIMEDAKNDELYTFKCGDMQLAICNDGYEGYLYLNKKHEFAYSVMHSQTGTYIRIRPDQKVKLREFMLSKI